MFNDYLNLLNIYESKLENCKLGCTHCTNCCIHGKNMEIPTIEWEYINKYCLENDIYYIDNINSCGFLKNGKCTIYTVRPLVCRLYTCKFRFKYMSELSKDILNINLKYITKYNILEKTKFMKTLGIINKVGDTNGKIGTE